MNGQKVSERSASHDLYKLSGGKYMVKSFRLSKPYILPDLDGACQALLEVGIPDDEIDFAVMDMIAKDHNHCQFGVNKGSFIFSDVVDPAEIK